MVHEEEEGPKNIIFCPRSMTLIVLKMMFMHENTKTVENMYTDTFLGMILAAFNNKPQFYQVFKCSSSFLYWYAYQPICINPSLEGNPSRCGTLQTAIIVHFLRLGPTQHKTIRHRYLSDCRQTIVTPVRPSVPTSYLCLKGDNQCPNGNIIHFEATTHSFTAGWSVRPLTSWLLLV